MVLKTHMTLLPCHHGLSRLPGRVSYLSFNLDGGKWNR